MASIETQKVGFRIVDYRNTERSSIGVPVCVVSLYPVLYELRFAVRVSCYSDCVSCLVFSCLSRVGFSPQSSPYARRRLLTNSVKFRSIAPSASCFAWMYFFDRHVWSIEYRFTGYRTSNIVKLKTQSTIKCRPSNVSRSCFGGLTCVSLPIDRHAGYEKDQYPQVQQPYAPQPSAPQRQPAYAPNQQAGYAPQQPVYAPQQPAYAPQQQAGYAPPQAGYAPPQPGYAPQQAGYAQPQVKALNPQVI